MYMYSDKKFMHRLFTVLFLVKKTSQKCYAAYIPRH